ncbi:MAG TPA: DUF5916 domain-containing protein [Terriglobales bacterium]|nr:DUF5916 domain-containing protein [Terriglobales bacterium]
MMRRHRHRLHIRTRNLALLSLLAFALAATAQRPAPATGKSVRAVRVDDARIKLDGELDEAVWRQAALIDRFTQTEPDQHQPVSEKTEVLIFYTSRALYFGFRCYDRTPDKAFYRLGAHDADTGSDSVDVLIDTFHDRRTGFYFSINSSGIQFDAASTEGAGGGFGDVHDSTWDGIWSSAARRQPWGWSAEIEIPFRSIRVPHGDDQVWGLNINRTIPRRNEMAAWVEVQRFDGFMRPSKLGEMTGISGIETGKNLELIPYFTTRWRRAPWLPAHDGWSADGGLDVRWGFTPNLTASLTFNPDFGDTEADEFFTDISRFEVFFPEKRKFFTEGANYFATNMSLFFSRRIGARLDDGEPQRILAGGKITGKTGRWTIGLLEALTERTELVEPNSGTPELAPAALFSVARIQRDIFNKSSVGLLVVNRTQGDAPPGFLEVGESQAAYALDLNLLHGEHVSSQSQVFVNTSDSFPGVGASHMGWATNYQYSSDTWYFGGFAKYLGDRVNVDAIGFEPATGRYSGDLDLVYRPFINRFGVRQLFLEANYDQSTLVDGALDDSGADLIARAQFKNFWSARVSYHYDRVRFCTFTAAFTCLATFEIYQDPKWRFQVTSNQQRALSFDVLLTSGKFVEFDENFHGFRRRWEANMKARLGRHLKWQLSGVHERQYLLDGVFFQDRRFLVSRVNYQFTPKWRARVLAQYGDNRHGTEVNVNGLVAYDFTARSAFYLGYNYQRGSPLDRSDLGHEVFLKLSYLFPF